MKTLQFQVNLKYSLLYNRLLAYLRVLEEWQTILVDTSKSLGSAGLLLCSAFQLAEHRVYLLLLLLVVRVTLSAPFVSLTFIFLLSMIKLVALGK